jgi:hypothetical protein
MELAWKWSCRSTGLAGFVYLLLTHLQTAPPQAWIAVAGVGGFGDVIAANLKYRRGGGK